MSGDATLRSSKFPASMRAEYASLSPHSTLHQCRDTKIPSAATVEIVKQGHTHAKRRNDVFFL